MKVKKIGYFICKILSKEPIKRQFSFMLCKVEAKIVRMEISGRLRSIREKNCT